MIISRCKIQPNSSASIEHNMRIELENFRLYFSHNLNFEERFVNGKIMNDFIYKKGEYSEFSVNYVDRGYLNVFANFYHDEIIIELDKIAKDFDATLLYSINKSYPKFKVDVARKRLALKTRQSKTKFQERSLLNTYFMVIKSDVNSVMAYFNLEGEEICWGRAVENIYSGGFILLYEFRGWTFVSANVMKLFNLKHLSNSLSFEKEVIQKLTEIGQFFEDVQLYGYSIKAVFFTECYRVYKKKFYYGEYLDGEGERRRYGRRPKEIISLYDIDVPYVAEVWSYDPFYMIYCIETKDANVWVAN